MLRFCQGLAVGGQWGGAVLLATEYAPEGKLLRELRPGWGARRARPRDSSFLILTAIMGEGAFAAWARIPFLLSVILIGVALYIQLRLEDTPVFRQLEERQHEGEEAESGSPVLEVLRDHPKQVLLAGGAFFVNGAYYVMITGMLDYGTRSLGVSQNIMLAAVLISSFAQILLPGGPVALGSRRTPPVYLAGAALLGLWAFPMFWLVNTESPFLITLALFIGQMFLAMMYGPQAALLEMFSAGYATRVLDRLPGRICFGGLAPIIMVWLLESTGVAVDLLVRLRDGRRYLRLGLPDHGDLRGRNDPGSGTGDRRGGGYYRLASPTVSSLCAPRNRGALFWKEGSCTRPCSTRKMTGWPISP